MKFQATHKILVDGIECYFDMGSNQFTPVRKEDAAQFIDKTVDLLGATFIDTYPGGMEIEV